MKKRCVVCGEEKSVSHNFKGNPVCTDKCYINLLEKENSKVKPVKSGLTVESGVSSKTRKGFLTIRWGQAVGQVDCEDAIKLGLRIIVAANAADSDAAVIKMLGEDLGLEMEAVQNVLLGMRKHRSLGKA